MPVNIDTVYQRVLALANKEQRGYITPQEYNLLANQAQSLIFEQYFYDLDKALETHANNTEYSDRTKEIQERIAPFENNNVNTASVSGNAITLPTDLHRLGTVFYINNGQNVKVERVDANEVEMMQQTALYAATQSRPVYVRRSDTIIDLYPSSLTYLTTTVKCNYIEKPTQVVWGYTVVNNQALYNAAASTNFSLHAAEEIDLVYKILEMAGIVLNKPGLVQIATNEETGLIAKKQ